ncbi:spore gernimation protein GerPD [Paenibacillus sp. SCIV0701]|uniref:Spore gernimation protein GerPD n=1 Tax=Paenibacillus soyae TaxID=2969249 RepID=A0A9X2MNW7_9BACL|nr:spore gernimation protein GerPD [Paenibacillus soyae]
MRFHVTNHSLAVGQIEVLGVSSASMLQVGDTDNVMLYSMFDTPPESVIVGPLAPFPSPEGADTAIGESNVQDD